jgi:hypothetical protein
MLPQGNGGPIRGVRTSCERFGIVDTCYLQQALAQGQETEGVLNPDEVARLSPLLHEQVNRVGRYAFILPEAVAAGQLR